MPRHPTRYYGSGDLHFITACCYRRRPLLATPARRDLFLDVLEQMRRRYRFAVLGYVVMPEHFHLLVSEQQRMTLSTVVQGLKLGFSRRLLSPGQAVRPASPGHAPQRIWQTRFYNFNVWTEHKLRRFAGVTLSAAKWRACSRNPERSRGIKKLRYIHRNPGLVDSPEQWCWSSFRFYLYGEPGPVRVNDTDTLVMRIRGHAA